jgi:hypothetical protein
MKTNGWIGAPKRTEPSWCSHDAPRADLSILAFVIRFSYSPLKPHPALKVFEARVRAEWIESRAQ